MFLCEILRKLVQKGKGVEIVTRLNPAVKVKQTLNKHLQMTKMPRKTSNVEVDHNNVTGFEKRSNFVLT